MAKVSKAREAFVKKQMNLMLQRVIDAAKYFGIKEEYGTGSGPDTAGRALNAAVTDFESFIEVSMAARPEDDLGWYHKCALCGKARADHNNTDRACPVGRPHRTLGYTSFSATDVFCPTGTLVPTKTKKVI